MTPCLSHLSQELAEAQTSWVCCEVSSWASLVWLWEAVDLAMDPRWDPLVVVPEVAALEAVQWGPELMTQGPHHPPGAHRQVLVGLVVPRVLLGPMELPKMGSSESMASHQGSTRSLPVGHS